jgi:GNAT superfamily N-acetyltransferase
MIGVRAREPADQSWIESMLQRWWGGRHVVVHGQEFDAALLPALIGGDLQGLLTFAVMAPHAEIVTLNALTRWHGVGSALVETLAADLAKSDVREIRLTTTNDNLDALRFYQRRGFRIAAVRPGAVDEARQKKPSIAAVGNYGIARHDELELVRVLG